MRYEQNLGKLVTGKRVRTVKVEKPKKKKSKPKIGKDEEYLYRYIPPSEQKKKEEEFNIVDKPKDYEPTYPIFVTGKETLWEKVKKKVKGLFKE